MARNRLDLQAQLEALPGIKGVYYDPPASVKLKYDCIIYNLSGMPANYADNIRYVGRTRYEITLISKDPDLALGSSLVDAFKYCTFERFYSMDGLHHWVYTLFF